MNRFLVTSLILAIPNIGLADPQLIILDNTTIEQAKTKAAAQKQDAQRVVQKQADLLGYSAKQIKSALQPTLELSGHFKVRLNDGTVVQFPWFRTGFAENKLANTAKPIARDSHGVARRQETNKGGVRLHLGVFPAEVYALALKMDTKLATARDALGNNSFRGAKGGIGMGEVLKAGATSGVKKGDFIDPASPGLNRKAIMKGFAKSYVKKGGQVGPGLDIQAGDVNTKAAEMKVLAETHGSKDHPSAGISGKAVIKKADGSIDPRGGIEYRAVSTGEGVWMSCRLAAKRVGLSLKGSTFVAQGWGEVGRACGLGAKKDGALVIAIQERWNVGGRILNGVVQFPGTTLNSRAVNRWLNEVDALHRSGKDLLTYKGGRFASHFQEGLDSSSIRADVVGINAMGNVLNKDTVPAYIASGTHQGKRKILIEGANLAETADGAKLLDRHQRKILAVAGDLANLGGVHVSNLEAVQNVYKKAVSSLKARRSLEKTMKAGWKRAMKIAKQYKVTERQAIELAAVDAMMKRSLHLKGAPRTNLVERVLGRWRGPKAQPRAKSVRQLRASR